MKLKLALILFLALMLFACGDSKKEEAPEKADENPVVTPTEPTAEKETTVMTNQEFMDEYAKKEGVQSTASGLLYTVIKSGDNAGASPSAEDTVTVHYAGRLIDGTEFDSSYKRGETISFPLNGVIKGWTEILQLMKPGDKWEVVIPSELGYGARATGPIPANSTLIFEIELFSFQTAAEVAREKEEKQQAFVQAQTDYLTEHAKQDGVTVTATGLHCKPVKTIEDGKTVQPGDVVTGHIKVTLLDGTVVSDTKQQGQPIDYPVDGVFPGWSEAAQMMKAGEEYHFVIPAALAFGDAGFARGGVPGGATILMELTVEQIKTQAEIAAEEAAFRQQQEGFISDYQSKYGDAVKTESGLVYRVIKEGTGNIPTESQTVSVHYKGTLTDGSQFDSSYDRGSPSEFPVNGVISGWVEALQLMKEGATYELVIPANLAYGDRGTPTIPPGSTLVFTVELLAIK